MENKRKKGIAPPRYDEAFKAGAIRMVTEQGRSEHRGCQGTWYLHRHPAQLAEGRWCAGGSGRPPEPGQPPDTGAGSGGACTAQAAGRER